MLYISVDVWVRNQNDGLAEVNNHQDPIFDQTNYIYVRVRNGGLATNGGLEVHVSDANTNLQWGGGGSFTPINSSAVSISQNDTQIGTIPWSTVPDPTIAGGHFCLYVRWVSVADPMNASESASVWQNVVNNNIARKNLNIVDYQRSVLVGGQTPHGRVHFLIDAKTAKLRFSSTGLKGAAADFFKDHVMLLQFDDRTALRVRSFLDQSKGVELVSASMFRVGSNGAEIIFGAESAERRGFVDVIFQRKKNSQPGGADYLLNIDHFEDDGISGGYAIQIK